MGRTIKTYVIKLNIETYREKIIEKWKKQGFDVRKKKIKCSSCGKWKGVNNCEKKMRSLLRRYIFIEDYLCMNCRKITTLKDKNFYTQKRPYS